MARTFSYDAARDVIHVSASGVFSDSDFMATTSDAFALPTIGPAIRVLVDATKLDLLPIRLSALEEFVQLGFFPDGGRSAFIVTSGFARAFVELTKISGAKEQVRAFECRSDAIAWLNEGVTPDKLIT